MSVSRKGSCYNENGLLRYMVGSVLTHVFGHFSYTIQYTGTWAMRTYCTAGNKVLFIIRFTLKVHYRGSHGSCRLQEPGICFCGAGSLEQISQLGSNQPLPI